MAGGFRFIHSGEFHLEQPLHGLAEVPEHFRRAWIDAPYTAAERVFDAAINQRVDFLLLSGDLINLRTSGARGPAFLLEQFERLAEKDIPIYWLGGEVDPPHSWPVEVPLPPNVHRPERNVTERYALESHGNHIADIACRSFVSREPIAAKEFGVARRGTPSADAPVTIAAAYGRLGRDLADGTASDLPALFDHETLRHPDIPCWCLGGDHAPRTHSAAPHTVRVCGTPQGRSQRDEGPRSCTLYDVDAAGNVQHRPIETDAIRFVNETVHLDEDFSVEDAKLFLDEAITALIHSVGKRHAVIHWEIVAEGPVANQLESIAGNAEMLEYLQTTYGTSDPVIWSADLEVILIVPGFKP